MRNRNNNKQKALQHNAYPIYYPLPTTHYPLNHQEHS